MLSRHAFRFAVMFRFIIASLQANHADASLAPPHPCPSPKGEGKARVLRWARVSDRLPQMPAQAGIHDATLELSTMTCCFHWGLARKRTTIHWLAAALSRNFDSFDER